MFRVSLLHVCLATEICLQQLDSIGKGACMQISQMSNMMAIGWNVLVSCSSIIGEMKSYPSFLRSPRFTVCVSIRRAFGGFARKPSDLLEIAKWSNTSLPHRKQIQNIFVKPLKLNFISMGRSGNC
jgi:hypothetical protein